MSNSCSYGFSGGLAAICAAISWYLVTDKSCGFKSFSSLVSTSNPMNDLQLFHYIAMITGGVIFVLSFFDFAAVLYDITLLFVAAVLGIFATGAMMLYSTYMTFHLSCNGAVQGYIDKLKDADNVIAANDVFGIVVMSLNLIAALSLISAAISFSRTY